MGYASIINLRLATEPGADIERHTAVAEGGRHSLLPHSVQPTVPEPAAVDTFLRTITAPGNTCVHSLSGRWKSRRDVAHENAQSSLAWTPTRRWKKRRSSG